MFRRNRNRDSCEKNATGMENTGIGNLVDGHHDASVLYAHIADGGGPGLS